VSDATETELWFYRGTDGKKWRVSKEELLKRLVDQDIPPESPVWRYGMETWVPAVELAEFRLACSASPARASARRLVRREIAIVGLVAIVPLGIAWLWSLRGPKRHSLRGDIVYQGHRIDRGTIIFDPVSGELEKCSAIIRSGSFCVPSIEGLRRGQSYVLRIYAYRTAERSPQGAIEDATVDRQQQILPAEFNKESQLTFEASRGNLKKGLALQLP
jgi:hypothetical protein